jgi:hypothetical protein
LPSPYGAIPLLLVALEVVVEVIHLPFDAVGIFHPELVLVGVAAVDAHLITWTPTWSIVPRRRGRPSNARG